MIFFPKGVLAKETADPETLHRDYQEKTKITEDISHHQYRQGSFEIGLFNEEHCKLVTDSLAIKPKVTKGNGPILPFRITSSSTVSDTASNSQDIPLSGGGTTTVGALESWFELDVDQGFADIPDTTVSWVADYPELVIVHLCFQYIRDANKNYMNDESSPLYGTETGDAIFSRSRKHRLQSAINIDGVNIVGTGPGGVSTGDSYRGTAFTGRSIAINVSTVQFLPAGSHVIKGVAGLAPTAAVKDNDGNVTRNTAFSRHSLPFPTSKTNDLNPANTNTVSASESDRLKLLGIGENAVIGTRKIAVIRFANGKLLE